MWFKELDIVAFGKWTDEKIHLDSGMNVLYGSNEAGKSSIRMFLTYILFGLKADERERYRSKHSGQLGGRLILVNQDEEWIIERFAHQNRGHRVGYLNGQLVSDEKIIQLLKGMDRYMFESIFSFQDRDLQAIRQYKSEDLGKVLFNIGMTGSDRVVELENNLTKQADHLFKKQGKKPPINEKLIALKQLNKDIEQAEKKEKEHQPLYHALNNLEDELKELKHNERNLLISSKNLEKLLQTKTSIAKHQMLTKELEELAHVKHFPNNGQERFEQLKEKKLLANEKINLLNEDLNQISQELNNVREKSQFKNWSFSIEEAQVVKKKAMEIKSEIKQQDEQRKELNYEYQRLLKDMGVKFSLKELIELPINTYTHERWKHLSLKWEELNNQKKSLNRKQKVKTEELKSQEKYYEQLANSMMDDDKVMQLNESYENLKRTEQKHAIEEEFKYKMANQQTSMKKLEQFLSVSKFMLPLFFLLTIALYSSFIYTNNYFDYGILFVLFLGTIFSFILLNQQQSKIKPSIQSSTNTNQVADDLKQQLHDYSVELDKYYKQKEELNQVLNQIQIIQASLNDLKTDLSIVEDQFRSIEEGINQEVNQFNFLSLYELFHWPKVFESLQQAKSHAENIMELEIRLKEKQSTLDQFVEQAQQIIRLYEHKDVSPELTWNMLDSILEKEQTWLHQIKQKNEWLFDKQKEIEKEKASFEPYENELNDLLNRVNVSTEKEFIKMCNDYEEYKVKKHRVEEAYSVVFEVFGEETGDVLSRQHKWMELEEQLAHQEQQLNKLNEAIENKRHLASEKKAQISQIEESGKLSDLIHKRAQLESEIYDLAKEWAVIKVAQGFLRDTKNRYQNVYLPVIMEQTRNYFKQMTNGRYVELNFSEIEETILVKSDQNDWFNVNQLSEGTSDQLYVALRLALNESLKRLVNVPFVFDDAFVHFDNERREQIIEQLDVIKNQQQVIYLTFDSNIKLQTKDINRTIHVS